ncbi:MAG: hypothetical protein ACREU6_10590 [Steroidobacteraceae bacterium]
MENRKEDPHATRWGRETRWLSQRLSGRTPLLMQTGPPAFGYFRFLPRSHWGTPSFEGWRRIIDYRYSFEPLSIAGSVKGEGGPFNVGAGLSPGAFDQHGCMNVHRGRRRRLNCL